MASRLKPPVHAEQTPTEPPIDVFPYSNDAAGTRLLTRRATGVFQTRSGDVSSDPLTCPDCESETINGAGLFACTECDWDGSFR